MQARGHLVGTYKGVLPLPKTEAGGDFHSKTMSDDRAHVQKGGGRHLTVFLCTQQLLKEKQGRPT